MAKPKQLSRVIMGIDPGTNRMGYGVLEVRGNQLKAIVLGIVDLHKIADPYGKLRYIFERTTALIAEYKPDEVALESPFFGENVQSMLKLGRAQGVAMAAALSRDCPVSEYAPRKIKQSIVGSGAASKEQVAVMLKSMLGIEIPKHLDATDGMAVAVCHYYQTASPINGVADDKVKGLGGGLKATSSRGSSSWEKFVEQNPEREVTSPKTTRQVKKPKI